MRCAAPGLLCLFVLLGACSGESAPARPAPAGLVAGAPGPPEAVSAGSAGHAPLPAYELPDEAAPAKADSGAEWRLAHRPLHAETEAPAVAGFRAMREWEPMRALLLVYADYLTDNAALDRTVLDILVPAADVAELWVIVHAHRAAEHLVAALAERGVDTSAGGPLRLFRFTNDSLWTIDFAPLPLVAPDERVAFLDFRYYKARARDDGLTTRLGRELGVTTYRLGKFGFEGGNFQADGLGTCYISHRTVWASGQPMEVLEDHFARYAGCHELVILNDVTNDATGHLDMFFKLVSPGRAILATFEPDEDETNAARMDENAERLAARVAPDDATPFEVLRMPMPHPGTTGDGQVVPFTYLNATLLNGLILWPVYGEDPDRQAVAEAVWQQALPDWQSVPIGCDRLALLSGSVHCITRTIPVGTFEPWLSDGVCCGTQCQGTAGGYDGACVTHADCFGPRWLCPCGKCSEPCPAGPGPLPCPAGVLAGACCAASERRACQADQFESAPCATACAAATPGGAARCDDATDSAAAQDCAALVTDARPTCLGADTASCRAGELEVTACDAAPCHQADLDLAACGPPSPAPALPEPSAGCDLAGRVGWRRDDAGRLVRFGCVSGETCVAGRCLPPCAAACTLGAAECLADGQEARACVPAEPTGCPAWQQTPCPAEAPCVAGRCRYPDGDVWQPADAAGPEPGQRQGGGCGTAPGSPAPLLILLLGLLRAGRGGPHRRPKRRQPPCAPNSL